MKPRYSIGTKFTLKGKNRSDECTVVDIYKTYNSMVEVVKIRYVCTHEFMGQTVTDYDVLETTIARAIGFNDVGNGVSILVS